jgi:hypothetical protein
MTSPLLEECSLHGIVPESALEQILNRLKQISSKSFGAYCSLVAMAIPSPGKRK